MVTVELDGEEIDLLLGNTVFMNIFCNSVDATKFIESMSIPDKDKPAWNNAMRLILKSKADDTVVIKKLVEAGRQAYGITVPEVN